MIVPFLRFTWGQMGLTLGFDWWGSGCWELSLNQSLSRLSLKIAMSICVSPPENHASRWIGDLGSKSVLQILAFLEDC